mgnify:CR=1 FL=1
MIMKRISGVIVSIFMLSQAASATVDADSLYRIYSGNMMEYPYSGEDAPRQTPAPEGYRPFHLEHYGRHGSRWLIGSNDYLNPIRSLETAERNGQLTPLGVKTLDVLREIEKASHNRLGELSDKGALQHQAIGRRMARTYPEIFSPGASIDAKATVVIRCILSMLNGLQGIQYVSPDVKVKSDASYADMYFMNYDDKPAWKVKDRADTTVLRAYRDTLPRPDSFLTRLVKDEKFARDSVAPGLMPDLYRVLANTQSHSGQPWILPEVFTVEEAREAWRDDNAGWIIHCVNSPMTDGRMPFVQRNLLRNMIESTDTAMMSATPGANLRYGHDGILINLITLLDINGLGRVFNTIGEAENAGLRSYELIPMAGNLQLVFYRNDDGDVLVKALLNEREATLPGTPVAGPYYDWKKLRAHYLRDVLPTHGF